MKLPALAAVAAFLINAQPGALAQQSGEGAAQPIPPVESGLVELEEIKPTASLDVKTGQSRVFRTKARIKRVSVSDPAMAEVVIVSEREFIVIGKAPGNISLFLWCQGDTAPRSRIM